MSTFGEASEDQPITNIVKAQLEGKSFSAKKVIEWERRKRIPLLNNVTIGMLEGVVLENGGKERDLELFRDRASQWVDEVKKAERDVTKTWAFLPIKSVVGITASAALSLLVSELGIEASLGLHITNASTAALDKLSLWFTLTTISSWFGVSYLIEDLKDKKAKLRHLKPGRELTDAVMNYVKKRKRTVR